jgi:hypothetical protein
VIRVPASVAAGAIPFLALDVGFPYRPERSKAGEALQVEPHPLVIAHPSLASANAFQATLEELLQQHVSVLCGSRR